MQNKGLNVGLRIVWVRVSVLACACVRVRVGVICIDSAAKHPRQFPDRRTCLSLPSPEASNCTHVKVLLRAAAMPSPGAQQTRGSCAVTIPPHLGPLLARGQGGCSAATCSPLQHCGGRGQPVHTGRLLTHACQRPHARACCLGRRHAHCNVDHPVRGIPTYQLAQKAKEAILVHFPCREGLGRGSHWHSLKHNSHAGDLGRKTPLDNVCSLFVVCAAFMKLEWHTTTFDRR